MAKHQLVSTAGMPERERLAFWSEAVCESVLEMRVDSTSGNAFEGAMDLYELGPLAFNFVRTDDQKLARTKQAISRGKTNLAFLCYSRSKTMAISQFGREVLIKPGTCALLDSRYPWTLENETNQDTLSIGIEANWLLTWLPAPEEAAARLWTPGDAWGGVLAQAMASITPGLLQEGPLPDSVMCDQIGALIALASSQPDDAREAGGQRPALVHRMRDTIRGSFHDPNLTPAAVARHHGVSVRYLHLQFARSGLSYGDELLRARLDAAGRMLSDPRHGGVSINEVALRSGFTNASHFARRFRERYGLSPSDFRLARQR